MSRHPKDIRSTQPLSVFPQIAELIKLRAQASKLELGARRLALSVQAGGYRSVYRGRGLEFDEVRIYQAGDEVRDIDWRVTARRGRTHTKLFREERDRPVLICTDLGPSMLFGSRQLKSAQAMKASSLFAWAAEKAGDRVGAVVIAADEHKAMPPKPRRDAVLRLLKTWVELQPTQAMPLVPELLDSGLLRLQHLAHPGTLIPVLSDFQTLGKAGEDALKRLARHNDLLLIHVFDPLEMALPTKGRFRLGLPGKVRQIEGAVQAKQWQQAFALQEARLQKLARQLTCPLISLASDADPIKALAHGLARHGHTR